MANGDRPRRFLRIVAQATFRRIGFLEVLLLGFHIAPLLPDEAARRKSLPFKAVRQSDRRRGECFRMGNY